MNGGVIRIYGGTMPNSPDLATTSPILGSITTEGRDFIQFYDTFEAGLLLQVVPPGVLLNDGTWILKGITDGTATWFRWYWKWEDDFGNSTYYPRVDGDIGLTNSLAALRLNSTIISPTTNRLIEQFFMQLPMEGV